MTARAMTLAELALVLDWAAAEGWNPGLDDAAAFFAADPQGFFVWDVAGQPVAAISVVNHDAQNAYLGLYLCQPAWRGRGIGFALWQAALQHAGARSIGLDGVAAQQANYARSGFAPLGSTLRLQGTLTADTAPTRTSPLVRPAQTADLPQILALDTAATGYSRAAFLTAWTQATTHRQTFVLGQGPRITGFATLRSCRTGHKIGPLIAPDVTTALCLIHTAAQNTKAHSLSIDIPSTNTALSAALAAAGFAETFRTARMSRGPAPRPKAAPTLQAIATMELG